MPKVSFAQVMQGLITIAIMGAALYVLMTPASSGETQKWAQNALCILTGFWLRGRSY